MKIVNLVLLLIAILLVLTLIFPEPVSITGGVSYFFDDSEPLCYFENNGEQHQIPVDLCCYEIQSQLNCKENSDPNNRFNVLDSQGQTTELSLKCYISESSKRFYLINHKMLNYCLKEGYDVKNG